MLELHLLPIVPLIVAKKHRHGIACVPIEVQVLLSELELEVDCMDTYILLNVTRVVSIPAKHIIDYVEKGGFADSTAASGISENYIESFIEGDIA